ncbi:glycine-rich domain-containing protein [Corynebacterium macginleyi]
MPTINKNDITDVYLGTVEAKALFAGESLVWIRRAQHTYSSPGRHLINVPKWAAFMTYLLVGSGAGGSVGRTGYNGNGGRAGAVEMGGVKILPGSSITISVGAGGRGGTSSRSPGNGEGTTVSYNRSVSSRTFSMGQAGKGQTVGSSGESAAHLRPREHPYLAAHLDNPNGEFTLSSPGRSPGTAGRVGGGGAGGRGGSRSTSAGNGGSGGDGYAQVVFFGIEPPRGKTDTSPSGSFRGEWAAGVQYVEGDTFTFRGQRFRVKRSHTSSGGGGSPALIDTPGIAQSYYERM